ncbi:TraB/GumN family protein [Maricaulis parjimensis]|uniref:TraB/GumN family protein n=1 Tax=Maricaulis parjimensis TaxID=144023 RepID=UPI00193A5B69|nr:TraB/GumN family protein [Maricaulis parjimensis]
MSLVPTLRRSAAALGFSAGLAIGLAVPAQAQEGVDYAAIEASPALWHVGDADSDIYIFGTFHILPADLDWQSDTVMQAFEASDVLMLEADVHSPEAQQVMQGLIPQLAFNPPGVTLSSMLDEEGRALLNEIAPQLGAAPAMLEPMRPWFAQVVLAVGQMQQMGFDPNAGVEMRLLQARPGDMTMDYFETAEEQLGFLAGLSDEIQAAGLVESLREMERLPEQLDEMVLAWAEGDMEAINTLLLEQMQGEAPDVYDAIIVQRNHAWIPQILERLEGEGAYFIAVGAGHLPGDEGVIELLREHGLSVTRQ